MIFRFFFVLLVVFSNVSHAQPKENRVALVMGNSAYKTAPLKNPTNDAKDMVAKLKGMGFTVVERNNLTTKQIGSTLREFRSKLTPGSVALVYYAGHGLQIKGENYFPTVDAEIAGEEDVPNQSLAMRQIMDVLEDAKTRLNLVFLDACRNNPYQRSFRSSSDGLSRVNAPSGTLISFATRPGSVAADGTGRNGLYTGALLEAMDSKGEQIELVLKRVVTRVKAVSKNQQEPWMEGSIDGDFCFGVCVVNTESNTSMGSSYSEREERFWKDALEINTIQSYAAYLKNYPNGYYFDLANAKIEKNNSESAKKTEKDNASSASVISVIPRMAFINADAFLNRSDTQRNDLSKINFQLKSFAEKYGIKVIIQSAVYVNPKNSITEVFKDYINGRAVPFDSISQLPALTQNNFRFIDASRVLKSSAPAIRSAKSLEIEFKRRENDLRATEDKNSRDFIRKSKEFTDDLNFRKNEETAKIIKLINSAINNLAAQDGIDIVLQKVVYVSPEYDLTDRIISVLP